MRLIPLLAVAGAAAWFYNKSRKLRGGSQTNASEAVDDIELGSQPSRNEMLDAGVKETFPASDPISVEADETAYEKNKRLGG